MKPDFSGTLTWEGSGGDAARAAMTATAGQHDEAAQNLGRAAGGMEQAEHDAEDVANRIKAILNYADERPAVEVNTSTNQVVPPSTDYLTDEAPAAVSAKVSGLQGQVAAVLARGEQVDADLARAIATATGVPTAVGASRSVDGGAGAYRPPAANHADSPGKDGVLGPAGGLGPGSPAPGGVPGQPPQAGVTPSSPQEANTTIGNVGDAIDKSASKAAEYAGVPPRAQGLGPTQGQLNRIATRSATSWETLAKVGRPLGWVGNAMEAANGFNEYIAEIDAGKSAGEAVVDVAPKTAGSMAGGFMGAAAGAEYGAGIGAAAGSVVPGVGTAAGAAVGAGVGAVAGGVAGSKVGTAIGEAISKGWHAIVDD